MIFILWLNAERTVTEGHYNKINSIGRICVLQILLYMCFVAIFSL
jgi:hypothetical protein